MDSMWRFVHLTDTHLGADSDGNGNHRLIRTRMPAIISCLRRDLQQLQPDFLLTTGDLASLHMRDSVFAARDLLDSLGCPYFPVGGNSDFTHENAREWFVDAFHAQLPVRDTVYSFTHRGLHFCVLDPWWQWADGAICPFSQGDIQRPVWAIPPHQLEWLSDDLKAHCDTPTMLAMHYPASPLPDRMGQRDGVDRGHLANGEMLMRLLRNFKQVRAIFCGHAHMNCVHEAHGITQISTSSLIEFPNEFRVVEVYEDHLELRCCGLSDTAFAVNSLVEGNEWTAGEKSDREVMIPFENSPMRAAAVAS